MLSLLLNARGGTRIRVGMLPGPACNPYETSVMLTVPVRSLKYGWRSRFAIGSAARRAVDECTPNRPRIPNAAHLFVD